ncbi:MAG TPA: FeoA family protein [Ferruginibacter sp.]|nr:ferrous iron transport protein A [Chitinophagaceae bacterium]HRI23396.1 FeoA family protein [Ferruginibacter sp.]
MRKRLSEISIGKTVTICEFENDEIFLKLMEMGCIPGEPINVDQVAPLGDPISISVAGYRLSLRLDEAEKIWVEDNMVQSEG